MKLPAMQLPVIHGLIDRRILINFQVRPDALARVLPEPFRPQLVGGAGIAGICLIRLAQMRPRLVPRWLGMGSENAAHRIAVEWDRDGGRREGVYIPRRDTSSRFNVAVGGRVFPGFHHHARFQVREGNGQYRVGVNSDDGLTHLAIEARAAERLPASSAFSSLDEASEFFRRGCLGYSATPTCGMFDGLELRSATWSVEPLAVDRVESSFFDDPRRFPRGSIRFDSALLMRRVEHQWHAHDPLAVSPCN